MLNSLFGWLVKQTTSVLQRKILPSVQHFFAHAYQYQNKSVLQKQFKTALSWTSYMHTIQVNMADRSSIVARVMCYNSEGRWFDPSWCHCIFSLT